MSLTDTTPAPPTAAVPRAATHERGVLLVAAGAAFLALLDTTVANLAVSDVRTDFAGTSVGGATWLITIYAVVFAALLAPAGRVADVVGRRALLLAGVSAFTMFSLAHPDAGVAPYTHVYAFCTLATFAVAATALWLITKEHR